MKRICGKALLLAGACFAAPTDAHAAEDVETILSKFDKVIRDSFASAVSQIKLSTCKYQVVGGAIKCTEKPREVIVEMVQKY